jgi:hypothetical protein
MLLPAPMIILRQGRYYLTLLLFRAAFDKADLLYLRDTVEQQRHTEMEQRDSETAEFAAMRARIEREAEFEARLPLNRSSSLQKQGSGDREKHK